MSAFENLTVKSAEEIEIMRAGGQKLSLIKAQLKEKVTEGTRASDIEALATRLIKRLGGNPSFKMVPRYKWSTCVNVNDGVVHGIPRKDLVFKKGDIVSIDVGMYYQGFHTDTSFTVGISVDQKTACFLRLGDRALSRAIKKATAGRRIYDISQAIEMTVLKGGFFPVKALVGHGVGAFLHEEPQIPCFVQGKREESMLIRVGMVLAIEVMYTYGDTDLEISRDKWTISTRDGKISALFEETVAVTPDGPLVLT